jgi:hypothetical protein
MESIDELNTYLDAIKTDIPIITKDTNKTTIVKVKEYFTKVENDLHKHCLKLQSNIQDEINKGIELEYEIEPHTLVDSHPYVRLNIDFYCKSTSKDKYKNINYKCNLPNYDTIEKFINLLGSITNKKKFSIPNILTENEYVVYINLLCPNRNHLYNGQIQLEIFSINLTYITNHGRFLNIKSEIYNTGSQYAQINDMKDSEIILSNDKITYQYYYSHNNNSSIAPGYPKSIIDATEKPLTYKMPTIFIKILTAIYSENTQLLQECLEEYHTRYIENKKLKAENKEILETIKNPYEDMKPKYENLVKEHNDLKFAHTQLQHEYECLKIKMEEQRKLYMG